MIPSLTLLTKPKEPASTLKIVGEAVESKPGEQNHFRDNYARKTEAHPHGKPLKLLRKTYPSILWPKKFRYIFGEIWTGRAGKKVIITGPRGGGKSVLMGALGFCLWFIRNRSIVDMGGSLAQAKIVYGYFSSIVLSNDNILKYCKKDPLMEHTESREHNYFKALPASPKAVRGPHPDVLLGDEVCEAKDDIMHDALPMVTSSPNPLTILTSTFHKIFGVFQEIWDRADELGYTRFSFDIFDVTKSFDPTIWNDKELNRQIPDLQELEKLCAGRTGDPEGWVLIENIISAWQGKPTKDWFLVEFMGTRPSASGLVNDPIDVEEAMFDKKHTKNYNYKQGAQVVGGLDWGFSSMTSWVILMKHTDDVKVKLKNRNYTQVASEIIIEDICNDVKKYDIHVLYADSAGKFENDALQRELTKRRLRCKVVEVVFRKEKENMLGNYRAHFQRHKIKIPIEMQEAKWQHKRYRYIDGTDKPVKKDDHIPDATMCALQQWPLGKGRGHFRQPPQQDRKAIKDDPLFRGGITRGLIDKQH